MLFGLQVGVRLLREEGRERTWSRHAAIATGAQAGLEELGLRLVAARPIRSHTVTAAWLPDGLDWPTFNAAMRAKGLIVAGGQGAWTGRIMRFGHMGEVGIAEMAAAVRVMGETLSEFGHPADPPKAMRATHDAFEAMLAVRVP